MALSLGILGEASSVDFLAEVLVTDPDSNVRGAAVIAFGLIHDASAVPMLAKIVSSASASVQDKAYAIAALGYREPFPALSRIFENGTHRMEYRPLGELMRIL